MLIAISERFRNSTIAAQLRSSRSRRSGAGQSSAKVRLPLRVAIAWWAAMSLVGWGLVALSLEIVSHLLR